MKNLFALLLLVGIVAFTSQTFNPIQAQIVTTVKATKDTLTNADTAYVNFSVTNLAKSVEAHVTKVSGTVAGKVYFQATVDGTNYTTIDSLTLADQSVNYKVFPLHASNGRLTYATYRFSIYESGTCKSAPKGYLLRRSD
jgi:hypothetical protein